MNPTDDDAKPRRDGWFEHRGTWGEVTVGTVIADVSSRTKRWEIVDQAHGEQVQYGRTLWMRAREQTSGEEFTVTPRGKTIPLWILTQDPADTKTPAITAPTDADAIMLLVEKLGATHLASRDEKTGEITCPDYLYDTHIDEPHSPILKGLIEHMATAHGLTGAAGMNILDATNLHAKAHRIGSTIGTGGFPHRHVPEDSYLITGRAPS